MKSARNSAVLFITVSVCLSGANAWGIEGVSPGEADRMAQVNNTCPTFSWQEDDASKLYEIVAYSLHTDEDPADAELTAETEVLYSKIAAGATSWTPSADQCFAPGGQYVWFVRAVTELIDDQAIEAGEWSDGRYFTVPEAPSAEEMKRALDVLKNWEAANGGGSLMLLYAAAPAAGTVAVPASAPDSGSGSSHSKSVPTASAAIRGEHPEASGEKYGVVGTSASVDGAGVAAANLDGGPDLVLDGSAQGVPDTTISEAGIDRVSAGQSTFTLQNSGAGRIDLDVIGDVYAGTIDIEEFKINGSTVVDDTGEWMGLGSTVPCTNCVGSTDIADGAVATADLADSSVDYHKIAIGNVRTGHLQDGAVRSDKIFDGAVTAAKLAPGAVGSAVLGPDSVDSSHIVDDAVTGAKILNGTITGSDLASDAVSGAKILDGTVDTEDLRPGAVTSAQIENGAVTTVDLAAGAVNSITIVDDGILAADLAAGSVGTSEIADGSIMGADIQDGTIGTVDISTGGVTSSDIRDDTITHVDVDPAGGIYSSKSEVYEVSVSETVSSAFCDTAVAGCADGNDLPLSWYCFGDPNQGLRPAVLDTISWGSTSAAANVSCTYCNDSASTKSFEAHILCISVPGTGP